MRLLQNTKQRIKRMIHARRGADKHDASKRAFMGAAAAAPFVAPAVASAFAQRGMVPPSGWMAGEIMASELSPVECTDSVACAPESIAERVAYYRREIADLYEDYGDKLTDNIRSMKVGPFDADLASMRSLSLTARVRIQAKRDLDRRIEERRNSYEKRIFQILNGRDS